MTSQCEGSRFFAGLLTMTEWQVSGGDPAHNPHWLTQAALLQKRSFWEARSSRENRKTEVVGGGTER